MNVRKLVYSSIYSGCSNRGRAGIEAKNGRKAGVVLDNMGGCAAPGEKILPMGKSLKKGEKKMEKKQERRKPCVKVA